MNHEHYEKKLNKIKKMLLFFNSLRWISISLVVCTSKYCFNLSCLVTSVVLPMYYNIFSKSSKCEKLIFFLYCSYCFMTIHSNVSFVFLYDKLCLCLDILLQLMASGVTSYIQILHFAYSYYVISWGLR